MFAHSLKSNSLIQPIDKTLSGATTLGHSGPGSNDNEGVLCIPQNSSITGASSSDCLVLYPGHIQMGKISVGKNAVSVFYIPNQLGYVIKWSVSSCRCIRTIKLLCHMDFNEIPGEKANFLCLLMGSQAYFQYIIFWNSKIMKLNFIVSLFCVCQLT